MYCNEREAGNSILSWLSGEKSNLEKLKREDVFFTSKLLGNQSSNPLRPAG
jgi:hypothetical protein